MDVQLLQRNACLTALAVCLLSPGSVMAQNANPASSDLGGLFLDLSRVKLGAISSADDKKEYLTTISLQESRITQSALRTIYENAYDMYKAGDYAGARELTAKILSIDPNFRDAFMLQRASMELTGSSQPLLSQNRLVQERFEEGMILYRQGRLVEAAAKWDEATKLSPWNFKARYWLGKAHQALAEDHFLKGQRAYREHRLKDTLDQWYAALVLNPRYPDLVSSIAKVESQLREEEANDKLQEALNLYGEGETADALKKIDEVLQYGPENDKARKLMTELRSEMAGQHAAQGREFYEARRYDEAIAEWKTAVDYGYDPAVADQLIARAKEEVHRAELAKLNQERLAKEQAAQAQKDAEDKAKAEADAKAKAAAAAAAQAQQPQQPQAPQPPAQISEETKRASQQHYLSGVVYYQQGNLSKARDEWTIAKQLDPENSDAEAGLEEIEKKISGGGP